MKSDKIVIQQKVIDDQKFYIFNNKFNISNTETYLIKKVKYKNNEVIFYYNNLDKKLLALSTKM